jgi:plastocyanin
MRTPISVLTVAVVVVLTAGCGGSKKSSAVTTGGKAVSGTTITIIEKEFTLSPSAITVAKAGTYTINGVNKGGTSHAIAIKGQGVDQQGATVDPGGTSTITVALSKPGAYEIYCPVGNHKALGMKGTLTLGGSAASSSGGGGTSTAKSGGYGYG